jgi:hypothetical protein
MDQNGKLQKLPADLTQDGFWQQETLDKSSPAYKLLFNIFTRGMRTEASEKGVPQDMEFAIRQLNNPSGQNRYVFYTVQKRAANGAQASRLTKDGSQGKEDKAMVADVGGIDLNPRNINLIIKSRSNGVDCVEDPDNWGCFDLEFTPVQIEQIRNRMEGLMPVIINVQPIINLPLFLGLGKDEEEPIFARVNLN